MSARTLDLLTGADFRFGLFVGAVALAAVILASVLIRARSPLTFGGLAIPAVMIVVVRPDAVVVLGLVALVLAGSIFPWTRRYPMVPALIAVPGALLVASAFEGLVPNWTRLYVVAAIAFIAPLAASLTLRYSGQAWGPALTAVSAIGVFFAVPDTEMALVVAAALLPLALLSWPVQLASLTPAGAYGFVGALILVLTTDGLARPYVLLGAVAVFGVFLAEPLAHLFARTLPFGGIAVGWRALFVVGGFHVVMVIAASRWAAVQQTSATAFAAGLGIVVAGAFLVYLSQPKSRPSS